MSTLAIAIAIERAIVMFATRDDIRRLRNELVASLHRRTLDASKWVPPLDREGHAVDSVLTYTCRFEVGR